MSHSLKSAIERLAAHKFWIEPSTGSDELRAFIGSVRPKATACPLFRVGKPGDGGYLLPNDLGGIVACVSPGVSTEISFDIEMAERGIDVFMADGSVDAPPQEHPKFRFFKKFLDVYEDESNMRLDTLCEEIPHTGDRLLQMDIEGAEYRVLLDATPQTMSSFRIMAIEFHHLTRAFGRFSFGLIKATFDKILRTHHVVHIHPNNVCRPTVRGDISIPPVMEFVFWRKDCARLDLAKRLQFPHPLDVLNVPSRPPLPLPHCWWRN